MHKLLLFISIMTLLSLHFTVVKINHVKDIEAKLAHKLYPYEDHLFMKYGDISPRSLAKYEQALEKLKLHNENGNRSFGTWVDQGPGNIGGRVNTIEVSNNGSWFLGFSIGGLYRSKDNGQNWHPVFDQNSSLSIGDIAAHPTQPNTIFVGTGDPNITGHPLIGNGLYKSLDNGNTWQYSGLKETRIISAVKIAPTSPNTIYVGAMGLPFMKSRDRGLYKSTNGGLTWEQKLFVNDSTGVIEVVVHPSDHKIVYAVTWNRIRNLRKSIVSGPDAAIYKSVDGGDSWTKMNTGVPEIMYSRIGLAICENNPNVLYASYVSNLDYGYNISHLVRTEDGGNAWSECNVGDGILDLKPAVTGGFGWYFGKLGVNPEDPLDVWVLGVDLWRSKDGGETWEVAAPAWSDYRVHADKHDILFHNGKIFLGTDGGAYMSDDDGVTWADIENISTSQFYRVAYNPFKTEYYYGGAQDNGSTGGNAMNINEWQRIFGGDGFQILFDHEDENIMYVETQNGSIYASIDRGESFFSVIDGIMMTDPRNWDTPLNMSIKNSKKLVTGTTRIYKKEHEDILQPWQAISPVLTSPNTKFYRKNISAIGISPFNDKFIVAGTSDGQLWVTTDDGENWKFIKSSSMPDLYISSCSFSSKFPDRLYVSFTGYVDNDNHTYLYVSDDLGDTWLSASKDLPEIAINKVFLLPGEVNTAFEYIFVATDGGVYYQKDTDPKWMRLGDNMPFVIVNDLTYNKAQNQLVAGSFGRGIQSFDLGQIGYYVNTDNFNVSLHQQLLENNLVSDQLMINPNYSHLRDFYFIYDMQGRFIEKHQGAKSINVQNYRSGAYLIKSSSGLAAKFVKI